MHNTIIICYGGLTRSQMGVGFVNHFTNPNEAIALGVNEYMEHMHDKPSRLAIRLMMEEGIDISKNKVKYADRSTVFNAERILVLCEKEKCPDYIANNEKSVFSFVKDPSYMKIGPAREIRDQIKLKVSNFLNTCN